MDEPGVTDYLIIGSSMSTILASGGGETAYSQLASRHEFFLDARGCRTLIGPSCSIGDRPAPPNTITALRTHAGTFDTAVVVIAGANDPTYGSTGIEASVDAILAEATRQGIRWVVWFTYREDSSVGPKMRAHNVVLRDIAAREPRLVLADWNERSNQIPRSWLSGDGIHIGSAAAVELADLIADTLDLVSISGPGDSECSLSRSRATVAGVATWTTDPAPVGSPRASRRATRLQLRCPD